ncbi:S24 family peptidase [Candidatus Methylospira mobilis]|uniref:LexA family protein n=1 Tax=Candidatus Methylospira mobilis TaxID=1808979 RepID=UPI0028EF6143|nr:S24 family peptidase [Candidatus Methylospira mobilis]WNV05019.1 S24 family peptidase [Candidatus Methylospira mobilis]
MSQRALAKRSGLSQQLISKLENGLVESTTEVFKLAEILHVDAVWLATGKETSAGPDTQNAAATAFVPLVSWVAAGLWREMENHLQPGSHEELVPVSCRVSRNAFALRVQGDSMEPVFPNGSYIIVDPALEAHHGSYVVMRMDDAEQATFKQLVIDGSERYLKPLNPRYPLMPIRQSVTVCGVVRQMLMNFDYNQPQN